LKFEFEQNFAR